MGTPGDRSRFNNISESKTIFAEERDTNDNGSSVASTIIKNDPSTITEVKTEPLEQTIIDNYYQEHKFTPTKVCKSESLHHLEKTTTFQDDFEVAGPSGLQTPKSNNKTKSHGASKKLKKTQIRKQYVCSVCQKCFQNLNKLSKHQQVHGNSSPFKCEHCKKSFSSKFKLVRHVLIHSDRKPFRCTICERTFHRKDHLKNHTKVHSPCKKLHICDKPTCKKEYTSLISFKKHLAFHAAEDGALDCLICEKSFKTKEEILYHLKVHAGSRTVKNPEEKKYSCDHCQRKFFTRKDVRRHMVVHTGRRDFLCQFCPQRFGRKDHLVRHIKKSHSKSTSSETEVKSEFMDDMSIKSEAEESNLSDAERFSTNLDFDTLLPIATYLPQPHTQGELADLGCEVLDVIPDPMVGTHLDTSVVSTTSEEALFEGSILGLPDNLMMNYMEDDNTRETTPLPAFSQIFQHQQPQQPPSPR